MEAVRQPFGDVKKDVLKNFANFTGKQLYQSLFLNKIAGLRPFLKNTSKWLLLIIVVSSWLLSFA